MASTLYFKFSEKKVKVTDLLHEKEDRDWVQKVSSYKKLRLTPSIVEKYLQNSCLTPVSTEIINRMIYLIVERRR